jgi:lysophospholipase L1-like esterase
MRPVTLAALLAVLITVYAAPAASAQRVVILGDSVAHGAGDETGNGIAGALSAITGKRVENLGINGARTFHVLRHLAKPATREAVRRADVIVLSIGGNDLFGDAIAQWRSLLAPRMATQFVLARVERVVRRIREENAHARILLLGLYNPYAQTKIAEWVRVHTTRWDARIIDRFAKTRAVTVIRIADVLERKLSPLDHFHPSAAGYRAIAQRIFSVL